MKEIEIRFETRLSFSFRPNKGQLAFLNKLERGSLGPFTIEFYGLRQAGQDEAFDSVQRAVNSTRLRGAAVVHNARVRLAASVETDLGVETAVLDVIGDSTREL